MEGSLLIKFDVFRTLPPAFLGIVAPPIVWPTLLWLLLWWADSVVLGDTSRLLTVRVAISYPYVHHGDSSRQQEAIYPKRRQTDD